MWCGGEASCGGAWLSANDSGLRWKQLMNVQVCVEMPRSWDANKEWPAVETECGRLEGLGSQGLEGWVPILDR